MDIFVVDGVEGPSLYVNDFRVAGPKPWGGGPVIAKWTITANRFVDRLKKARVSGLAADTNGGEQ